MSSETIDKRKIPEWEDSTIFGINKRQPHVPYFAHESVADALAYRKGDCLDHSRSQRLYLNSDSWNIHVYSGPYAVPKEFWKRNFDDSKWSKVAVPSTVECSGHGTPIYTNFRYPFPKEPPYIPEENPTACYRYQFDVPKKWIGTKGRLFLTFEAIGSAAYIWLNENFVGYTQDSMLPAEFEVSEIVLETSNLLAVQVLRWSDGSYLEDQDHWRVSGIFRDVHLVWKSHAFIEDYYWTTPMKFAKDGTMESAKFKVEAKIQKQDTAKLCFHMQLFNPNAGRFHLPLHSKKTELHITNFKQAILDNTGVKNRPTIGAYVDFEVDVTQEIGQTIHLWSAETPHTYLLVISLESFGKIIDCESSVVGFRFAEILNQQLLHNGKCLRICGVNRHEHDEWTGKVISEESMLQDIKLIKQHNFNAIRCSHYPNVFRFYELCSIYGLYLVDEANVETHGFDTILKNPEAHPTNSRQWTNAIVDRGIRMFERSKNNPAILMWSLGNESGYGPAHATMAGYFHDRDPTRVVHYEGSGQVVPVTDVICPMYARIEQIIELVNAPNEHRPLILCEYAHSMGNSTGNLQEYWDVIDTHRSLQGGFVWDWVDQGLMKRGDDGEYHWAYGGDFGDEPNDAQFCLNGLVSPDRAIFHPAIHECAFIFSPIKLHLQILESTGTLQAEITNRYSFITDVDLSYEWCLVQGDEDSKWSKLLKDVLNAGESVVVDVGELTHFQGTINQVASFQVKASLTQKTSWGNAGHIININKMALTEEQLIRYGWRYPPKLPASNDNQPTVQETAKSFIVHYPTFTISIEKSTGCISSIVKGTELLKSAIVPCFYRAPTDNDMGGGPRSYSTLWNTAGLNRLIILSADVALKPSESQSFIIHSTIRMGPSKERLIECKPSIEVHMKYTFNENVEIHWRFDTTKILPPVWIANMSLPRVGIRFSLNSEFSKVSWIGRGPFECYPDRKQAAFYGHYKVDSVSELHFPYIYPSESGGRADVHQVTFQSTANKSLIVKSYPESFQLNASIYPLESFTEAKHDYELEKNNETNVHIDALMMGVGGDDSWSPCVHDAYKILPGIYFLNLNFQIQ